MFESIEKDAYMQDFEITEEVINHLVLSGKAEDAVSILNELPKSSKDLPLWYFLSLAKAAHYTGNQQRTIDLYRYAILKFTKGGFAIYYEMLTHAPEMEELFEIIRKNICYLHDDSIYYLLTCPFESVSTAKQLSLYHERYAFLCDVLEQKSIPFCNPTRMYHTLAQQNLSDKNQDDLPIRKRLAGLCIQNVEGLVVQDFVKASPKDKIKVGICISRYDNIDFQTIIASLFQNFDSTKFELVFFGAMAHQKNANLPMLENLFDKVVFFEDQDWKQLRTILIQEKLDVFLAENVGFCAASFAFFSRVAPIQCNIIDRLCSFGAPFIDYYVCFGEKDAYKQWSRAKFDYEKYAILEDVYLSPDPCRVPAEEWDLTEIGLPKDAKFIFYPQSLNRMLPEDDFVVKALLENNPQMYFVALMGSDELRLIFYRWKAIMPDCMDRIIFMERQALKKFLWVIQQASVVLGSFKGGHGVITLTTVFSQAQPMVSGYGDCFGSSFSTFYYARMGIKGLIANSHEEAVEIAQRLIDDPQWKAEKSAEIAANIHKIFNPKKSSEDLQSFIIQAYDRAASGLPIENWEHGKFVE